MFFLNSLHNFLKTYHLDPDPYFFYGSGSRKPNFYGSSRIRIQNTGYNLLLPDTDLGADDEL